MQFTYLIKKTKKMKKITYLIIISISIIGCSENKTENIKQINNEIIIENEFEVANFIEAIKGSQLLYDLNDELISSKNDNAGQSKKLLILKEKIVYADKITAKLIQQIDKIKIDILQKKTNYKNSLINYGNEPFPNNFKLENFKGLEENLEFDISEKLLNSIITYRKEILLSAGNYQWDDKQYILKIKKTSNINDEISKSYNELIDKGTSLNKDDGSIFETIFSNISESIFKISNFENSNTISTLLYLTAIQHDILETRHLVISNWYYKVRH